jgi:hypothetical protein
MKKENKETAADPKYPHVKVKLSGKDGNAFSIMGTVAQAMRRAGIPKEERDAFFAEATKSAYDPVIATAMKWVDVSKCESMHFRAQPGPTDENTRRSSDSANKLIKRARDLILGPGVRKRIEADAALPKKYSGTDGIHYDPAWQDDIM